MYYHHHPQQPHDVSHELNNNYNNNAAGECLHCSRYTPQSRAGNNVNERAKYCCCFHQHMIQDYQNPDFVDFNKTPYDVSQISLQPDKNNVLLENMNKTLNLLEKKLEDFENV
jgi:hypothetical protein